MSDIILDRLIKMPERYIFNTRKCYGSEGYEFLYEKLLSILAIRLLGVSCEDISFDKNNLGLYVNSVYASQEEMLEIFFDRYVSSRNNLYTKLLYKLKDIATIYAIEPRNVSDAESFSNKEVVERLFGIVEDDVKKFDLITFLDVYPEFAAELKSLCSTCLGENYIDISIMVIKSEKIGSLLSSKESKLYKDSEAAIKEFIRTFGEGIAEGIYWGYEIFGEIYNDCIEDEYPFIFQSSFIAAEKLLLDTLK